MIRKSVLKCEDCTRVKYVINLSLFTITFIRLIK